MNREIKFRASFDGKIYKVETIHFEDEYAVLYEDSIYGITHEVKLSEITLMQFTGLHDKNGKEIYEGDILKPAYPPSQQKGNRIVSFSDGSFNYTLGSLLKDKYVGHLTQVRASMFYVIGNIYENNEILNHV